MPVVATPSAATDRGGPCVRGPESRAALRALMSGLWGAHYDGVWRAPAREHFMESEAPPWRSTGERQRMEPGLRRNHRPARRSTAGDRWASRRGRHDPPAPVPRVRGPESPLRICCELQRIGDHQPNGSVMSNMKLRSTLLGGVASSHGPPHMAGAPAVSLRGASMTRRPIEKPACWYLPR